MKKRYPKGTILYVTKLLYDLAETENQWFAIYLDYDKEKLNIEMSFYDACLFITKNDGKTFGIARLHTDDTLNVGTEEFINIEEKEITETKFKAKFKAKS